MRILILPLVSLPLMVSATTLPDTGQTLCDNGANVLVACSSANVGDTSTMPRQDGRYGLDAQAAAGVLTKVGGGAAGFDYTALDASGNATTPSSSANPHPCVRDNHTGLIWEVKTNDGGLHDKDWTFTWYNSDSSANGGDAGTASGGSCGGTVAAGCDTEKFIAAVNAAGWCGYTDGWRLPTFRELRTLVHSGTSNPAIETIYFPNTLPPSAALYTFWSASSYATRPSGAWVVDFYVGGNGADYKSMTYFVRLVRAGPF